MKGKVWLSLSILMIFVVACSHKPNIDVAQVLSKSEDQISALSNIQTTAAAFDGENIKFRLMMHGHPTREEAVQLFNMTLSKIKSNANNKGIWSYYNAILDIKNNTDGVIYQATKKAGQPLQVK